MRAIILAAGASTRLKPITDTTPKCLLDISGMCMLGRQLQALKDNGIMDVQLVVGFEEGKIISYIQNNFTDMRIRIIHNYEWETTNNAYSLELALEDSYAPFLLLNADVVCHPDLIKQVLNSKYPDVLGIQRRTVYNEEEMKVTVHNVMVGGNADGNHKKADIEQRIFEISKEIPESEQVNYEFTGIAKFTTYNTIRFFRNMLIGYRNNWFETALNEILKQNAEIFAEDVTHYPSIEIDFPEDLEHARDIFKWGQPDWEQGIKHESIETKGRNIDNAMKLLTNTCETLRRLGIKHWINWGLLLGATRDGQPIPWDTDMDVTIHVEDEEKLIKFAIPAMRELGCFVVDPAKCEEGDYWFIRDGEKIELNTVHLIGDKYVYSPGRSDLACPREYLDNLDKIEMLGYTFPTPSNREAYLEGSYGKSWTTPIKGRKPVSL